jgi:hypothetical protein
LIAAVCLNQIGRQLGICFEMRAQWRPALYFVEEVEERFFA